MSHLTLAPLLLLVVLLGSSLAILNDNTTITLLGPRIVVTLLPNSSCLYLRQPDHEIAYSLCFVSLGEQTPSGDIVEGYSFPSLTWAKWSNWTSASAVSMLPNGARVSLAAALFTEPNASISLGNESFAIPMNDLLWHVELASWPFQDARNTLALNWTMTHPALHSWERYASATPFPSTDIRLSASGVPDWIVAIFHQCLVDSTTRFNVSTSAWLDRGGANSSSSLVNVQLGLPSFASNLRFISTTWIDAGGESISLAFIFGVIGVSAGVVLLVLGMGICLPSCLLRRDYTQVVDRV